PGCRIERERAGDRVRLARAGRERERQCDARVGACRSSKSQKRAGSNGNKCESHVVILRNKDIGWLPRPNTSAADSPVTKRTYPRPVRRPARAVHENDIHVPTVPTCEVGGIWKPLLTPE